MIKVAVVIPCFNVRAHILQVIGKMGPEVDAIFVVDDACPQKTGEYVRANCTDSRVRVVVHEHNQGVGGAVMTGYRAAIAAGARVMVKVDGDGQMDPALIPYFVAPILDGTADYAKGNRFYNLDNVGRMPALRLLGNVGLSFMAKASTGYWNLFDPTNGYTAIDARVAAHLPFEKVSRRYFFETDILFRLNTLRAVVVDVPMDAQYGDEKSNMKISGIIGEFFMKHSANFAKRIFYNYFLRDMTAATFELVVGALMLTFGVLFGAVNWLAALQSQSATPLGTIMLAALPVIVGLQLVLAFLNYDVANVPQRAIARFMPDPQKEHVN